MARQNIANGSTANDGTGDTLRTAANKINENFVEIYRHFGGGDSDNLSSQISIEDSAIVFEGATVDAFETRLAATDVGADVLIRLPDSDGIVTLNEATQSLTNKTIETPQLNNPLIGGSILDSDNNDMILFTRNGPAINYFHFENNTSGNPIKITAASSGANVNFEISAKGEGTTQIYNLSHTNVEMTANGTISKAAGYIIFNKATALAATLADGFKTGQHKFFTNKGAGTATVTPTNFANGTSFALAQNEAAQCIWDGSNWFLIGNQSVTTVV